MSTDAIVTVLILATLAVWTVVEFGLIWRHHGDTISGTVFGWYRRYPPLGWLVGLGMGILGAHLFFPAGCL